MADAVLERVHGLRSRTPKKAKATICRLVLNLRSQFFQSRLFFSNQEKLRSTTHRFGNTAKRCNSFRLAISTSAPINSCTDEANAFTRVTTVSKDFLYRTKIIPPTFQCHQAAFSIRNIRRRYRKRMRQTLRVNRYMSLDTANLLARIVAFFHGGIRVLHTLRINNQESSCFMAPLLAALRNYLIFLMLPQGC